MDAETDDVQRNRQPAREIDPIDRKILGVLVDDATISYAELGDRVGLSPPAAHERVKRLRRSGAIRATSAIIDPKAVKKPLLAFVHIDTRGWGKTPELMAISECPEVEEIHSVAGDTCMLLKVRTEDTRALEGLLSRIYETPGVVSTRSYVVLSTYLERPVQPDITAEWPTPRHMATPVY
ncbi:MULTISPECIES: Lrp/AsnC family transcriptional regulator [unclassified Mesorhizobium]|uniref:Lrp/AsnC family transcriptional regulator n=1 Tax=unclassified Mesorhizobium TaxID=325217 RepID=UPI000F7655E7|nr:MULTISPECIES: Lrp/AsnC family transcriptional regulator [unclassified Mesorhizobium]AZO25347.1 Lrp/AsnC family transcriptional regulator [Mesorhizobium sp. M1E.F.Ca.ET.045.02.1.1]RUW34238.1 AsnC family transcriptional regulator [Mesorhizobium sp. M1E.F.Ca.ET.041.01.1.1]RUW84542.1 AsnC family transcriptional regulator [Mesorhizobium sp. M1E.F.Ca.ET.063.01.1.1]RWB59601.1 MAG: AsnC family transcriptional regulator [Mesorhizobium sp.]RWD85717.1 MAG: AsnC family transcriptional regulator [Mesorh